MTVSLIVTTKNEAMALPRLLDSIAVQTRHPDEIVIVDGGSTDATLEILSDNKHHLPLRVISQPDANISQGRNAAIRAALGDIICSTDAGVKLDARWVEELERALSARSPALQAEMPHAPVSVVSGFFLPDPGTVFETALAATTLPALDGIRPQTFLPSSRSIAFRKSAWEQVGGYPEWLDYCEDLIFDLALRAAGSRFTFAPHALVYFRPRESLWAFFKQYYRYARGDGKANLWLKRHLIRYGMYLVALPLLISLTLVWPLVVIPLWLACALGLFYTPYKRLLPMLGRLSWLDRARAVAWVPIIRITGDIAKMLGYPAGVLWRIHNRRVIG